MFIHGPATCTTIGPIIWAFSWALLRQPPLRRIPSPLPSSPWLRRSTTINTVHRSLRAASPLTPVHLHKVYPAEHFSHSRTASPIPPCAQCSFDVLNVWCKVSCFAALPLIPCIPKSHMKCCMFRPYSTILNALHVYK